MESNTQEKDLGRMSEVNIIACGSEERPGPTDNTEVTQTVVKYK